MDFYCRWMWWVKINIAVQRGERGKKHFIQTWVLMKLLQDEKLTPIIIGTVTEKV